MNDASPFNIDDFSRQSEAYYETIKTQLEAASKGKYAALDFESKRFWVGSTASEALALAKQAQPDRLFYVVLIGAPTTFIIQSVRRADRGGAVASFYGHRRLD